MPRHATDERRRRRRAAPGPARGWHLELVEMRWRRPDA